MSYSLNDNLSARGMGTRTTRIKRTNAEYLHSPPPVGGGVPVGGGGR